MAAAHSRRVKRIGRVGVLEDWNDGILEEIGIME
jgi:hypothetical protein